MNTETIRLKKCFDRINVLEKTINGLDEQMKNQPASKTKLKIFQSLQEDFKLLKLSGKDNAGDRQVGAWQSFKTTPYSALGDAEKVAMARLAIPSEQDWERILDASTLIDNFHERITSFEERLKKQFPKTMLIDSKK